MSERAVVLLVSLDCRAVGHMPNGTKDILVERVKMKATGYVDNWARGRYDQMSESARLMGSVYPNWRTPQEVLVCGTREGQGSPGLRHVW